MSARTSAAAIALAASSGLVLASGAHAAVIGTTGQVVAIAPPANTTLDAFESNTEARVWTERANVTLANALDVDITTPGLYDAAGDLTPGVIPAGTVVTSHYLRTDPIGESVRVYEGTATFSDTIIGIIVGRTRLNATDLLLGAPGTIYANNSARGLELSANADRVLLTLTQNEVRIRWTTSGATDDIRVITVPTPASAGIAACMGLAAVRRRRR